VLRRYLRTAARVALPLTALALLLPAAPPAVGSTEPTASATSVTPGDDTPVEVRVTGLAPRAPRDDGQPLQITGEVVNRGDETVEDVQLRLLVGRVIDSRSGLEAADEERDAGTPRGTALEPPATTLAPGESTPFDLRLLVGDLRLGRIGVYPVQVQATGREEGSRRRTPLGMASTFLPWFPDGPPAPTRLAFLWPLVDAPARAPDGALLNEGLAEAMALPDDDADDAVTGGRLGQLLAAARTGAPGACDPPPLAPPGAAPPEPPPPGAPAPPADTGCRGEPVPVSYAVDPGLLEAAVAFAGDHVTVGPSGERVPRPPRPEAAQWLDALRAALAGVPATDGAAGVPAAELLALPYADPDIVALTRSRTGLSDDVEQLRLLGQRLARDVTGTEPLDGVAWPPPGRLTFAALDASVTGGATAVVLDEDALPPRRFDADRTPGTRTALSSASGGTITGLVVDDALSQLIAVGPDDDGWQGARLAEQRWLAETAIIAAERPGESRTLLVAPPRRGDVVPAVAGQALLDAGRVPWLCAVPLPDVVAGTERCPSEPAGADDGDGPVVEERGDLRPDERAGELSPRFLEMVAEVRARADQFTDQVLVVASEEAAQTKARLLRARGRTVSSAWRAQPAGGRLLVTLLREEVDRLRSQVRLNTSGNVLLTSDSGVVFVDVLNSLDQPVTVGVELNDPVEARLTSSGTDVQLIAPGQQVQVPVRVEARTSGRFVVRATLLDRAGQPFGEPVELVVRSTGYGRLALTITGVGAGMLLVAAGVRITRRALRRAQPVAGPGGEPGDR
jgi:hypothetical protein